MFLNFKNEPLTDFNLSENKTAMEEALKQVDKQKGKHYPLIIGGEKIDTEDKITSINPSNGSEVIGTVAKADKALADRAMNSALAAFHKWKRVEGKERANYLFQAADVMRKQKFELSALLVEEVGKTWFEADADVAEAIDFLEYYGRQMLEYDKGMPVSPIPGEKNECIYIPLGVGIIISPWNFPLAILTGMTASAIVTGNAVIVKPASTSPIIAAKFMEILEQVGLPPGVVNFLPGPGGFVGDYLVEHPKTRFINFTGSKEVGLRINKLASEVVPGQIWLKRVIAELGGKNAIIVDKTADLDNAAKGIVNSAFGFQGQKCSACSRAIILEDVYDETVEKIVTLTKKLKVGPARNSDVDVGPVIDSKAFESILNYIKIGKAEGNLLVGGEKAGEEGYFIAPTIIEGVNGQAQIAQEEIFGPVLAIIKAKDFNEALEIANDTVYGLTGSVYSKDKDNLDKASREFHVGNLYLNRGCTGALVGGQPFGGFNLSGTDSKAGGADYLMLFLQPKTISEKI